MNPMAEDYCREFHAAWLKGHRPEIERYLPDADDPRRLATLLELIRIDMRMRVQDTLIDSESELDTYVEPLTVDEYVSRFQELRSTDLRERLRSELVMLQDPDPAATRLDSNLEARRPDALATRIADDRRYRVLTEHARGGMGVIYRVNDKKLGREVALKRLPTSKSQSSGTKNRFTSEARITAQLEHPGIVPIYDLTESGDGDVSYTMKLLRGETLTAAISRYHAMANDDPRRLVQRSKLIEAFLAICRAIAYAHARQVIHRDLKPDNVLLGEYGETVVLDWGLAKTISEVDGNEDSDQVDIDCQEESGPDVAPVIAASHLTQRGAVMGTPAYMPPEQARGEPVTFASDIYSLGAVLYQILTGEPPFRGGSLTELLQRVIEQKPVPPRTVVQDAPRALEAICQKALRKLPEERFESAAALVEDLECYLADEPVGCYRESLTERSYRWMRKHRQRVVIGIAAILLAAVSTTAYVLVDRAKQESLFAEQRRIQQARASAETADAVATQRMQNGDFASSVEILERAAAQLPDNSPLAGLRQSILEKRDRARQLATFYDLHRRLYHHSVTHETEIAYRMILQCLETLGIAGNDIADSGIAGYDTANNDTAGNDVANSDVTEHDSRWWEELPTGDLRKDQQVRLREEVYGLLLQLSATHATAAMAEFAYMNADANYFNVSTNELISQKMTRAVGILDRADRYRTTTAGSYLRLIAEVGRGDISFIRFIQQWLALAPQEPESAVDCFYTASIYGMSEQINREFPIFLMAAKLLGSETKMPDAQQEYERLIMKAIRYQPDYYPALYQAAMALSKRGNYLAAHQAFSTCISLDPDAAESYTGRAMALLVQSLVVEDEQWQGKLRQQSFDDIATALELAPRNGLILQEAGLLRCLLGDFEQGMPYLLQGSDRLPLRITGQTLLRQSERVQLENSIELTGDAGADPVMVAIYKSTLALDYGQPRDAWDLVSDVPEDHDYFDRVLALRAVAAHELTKESDDWSQVEAGLDAETVLSWAEQSLQLNAGFFRAWRAKILLLLRQHRYEDVLQAVADAQVHSGDFIDWQRFELLWLKSRALKQLGREAETEQAVEAAKAISTICYESVTRHSETQNQ